MQGGLVYSKYKNINFYGLYRLKLLLFGKLFKIPSQNLPPQRPVQDLNKPTLLLSDQSLNLQFPKRSSYHPHHQNPSHPPVQSNPFRRVTPAGWNPSRQRYPQKGWWFWSLWTRHLVASYTSAGTCSRGSQHVIWYKEKLVNMFKYVQILCSSIWLSGAMLMYNIHLGDSFKVLTIQRVRHEFD